VGFFNFKNVLAKTKDRNSFFWGVYNGLCSKLAEQETQTEQEAFGAIKETEGEQRTEEVKNCYALAKVNFKEELDKKLNEFYPRLGKATNARLNNDNGHAREAGFKSGRNINLRMGLNQGNGGQLE
jgi:hypothetical protein